MVSREANGRGGDTPVGQWGCPDVLAGMVVTAVLAVTATARLAALVQRRRVAR